MTTPTLDPEAFHAFEQAGWERVAGGYHDAFSRLTTQAVGPLLDAVGAGPGIRLLDVATGPGYAAGEAARRGARATGVDFAAAMLAEARRRVPKADFRQGDAEALPFPESSFDAVVMNFGLLHLARPERALAEACRVLRPGGRAAFTVWAPPEQAVAFGIVLRAVETHGNLNVPIPPGPPFFRFSDEQEFRQTLLGAGFANPRVTRVEQVWKLESTDTLFELMVRSSVRTGALLQAQSPEALGAIRNAIRAGVADYAAGDGICLPMPAVLASAQKPQTL